MKSAIVTGASRGIGKAIAKHLVKNGYNVAIVARTDEDIVSDLQEYAKTQGLSVIYYRQDAGDMSLAIKMYEDFKARFTSPDILVNNAGVSLYKLFTDCTDDDFDMLVNTNLRAMYNYTKCVVKDMIAKKSGNIVNISSVWGEVGASMEVLYSMTKGGVNSFTKALAKELGPSGIRVNAISAGYINTKMNEAFDDEDRQMIRDEIALSRLGEVEDIVGVFDFLVSKNASYITGQVIRADGGWI